MAVRKTMDEIMRDREAAKRRREQEETERANKLRTDPDSRNGFQANGLPGWTTPPETLQPEQMLRQKENRVPEEQIQKYYNMNIIQPSMSWEDYKKKLEEEKVTYTGVEGLTNDPYKSYLESIKDKTDAMNANSIKATEDEVKAQKNLVKALERMKNSRTMESTTEDGSKLYNGYSYEDEVKKLQQMENTEESRKQNEWLDKQQKNLNIMQDENVREYVKTIAEFRENQKINYSGVFIPGELEAYDNSMEEMKRLGYSEEDIISLKDTYIRESNAKAKAELHEEVENSVNKNVGSQILHSAGSVGANLLSGIGLVESAGAALQEAVSGEYVPVDTNSPYYYPGDYRDTVRENVAQNITNAVEKPVAKKVLPMVYQAGMSTADTLTASALGGEGFTLATMGAGAESGSAKDTFERTGDTGKALATGVAAGAIEVVTEKVSLDNLWDIVKKSGKAATRSTLVNLLVQSGVEGSEETVSEIANHIVDQMINGGMSEYNLNVQNYISQGMSEKEARAQANKDFGKQVLESFTVGAMAGAMGGGIGTVAGTVNQSMAGKELQESGDIKDIAARAYAYDDYFVQKALADYEKHPGGYQAANLYNEVARFEENVQMVNDEVQESTSAPKVYQQEQVNVEQSLQNLSQAQTAEELVEAVREVERAGSQEEIETARMRYEYRSEKLMSEGRISEAELQQVENSLTEQEAYELGLQNEKVEKDTLSLKGRIAYNQGMSEYNQERVAKNTISKKEIAKVQNADAVGSNGGKIKVFEIKSVDAGPVIVTSEGVEQLSEVSFENEAIQTLYNHASMQETVQAANTYLKNYPGGIMVQAYDMYYKRFLNAGKLGLSYENTLKRNQFVTSHISEESLREIYDAGKEIFHRDNKSSGTDSVKYRLVGHEKGIEVYETSEETKKLSYKERKAKLLDFMKNEYAGRTAKFKKNGQVYYALYDNMGTRKGVYGDKKSDNAGRDAKINIGADGNYIELAENALYQNSSKEQGKSNKFHKDAKVWDYYVKTIKSDGKYFDVLINVKDTGKDQYVYDITLKEAAAQYAIKHLYSGRTASKNSISQNMQNASKNQEIAPVQQKKVSRKGSGKVIDERRSNEAEPLMQLYEKLAEKTGQDIVLKDKDMEGINGEFNRSMSTIVFNMDAENKYTTIFHEALGEFSESWAPEQMAEFQNDLLEWYFNEYSDTEMNQIIGKYQEVYAEKEGAKSYREAANELVNDALAGLFTTETGMEDFTNWLYENKSQKEAKSVVQKIADLIKELCDKIRTYLKDADIGTAAKKALRMEADRAAGLRMRLLEIADEAAENYKRAEVGEKDTEESRYSLSEEVLKKLGKYDKDNYQAFQKEINNYLNGNFDASNSLMVMNSTPQILQQVGLENKRILMTARHFNDITHKESSKNPHWHGLTVQEVMEAPVLLNHPVIVADSLTRNDSVVVISESLDNKGRPIIIAMKTNGKGALDYQIVDSNFMTSMYGKDGFSNFVSKLISKNKILYINKEKSHGLYKNLRLQLPSTLVNLGFDKSIQQSKNVVNKNASETKNETKKFSLEVPLDNYEIVDDDVQMLRSVGRKSINEFTSEDIQKSQKWAYKFYQELGTKSPFFRTWFGDWRAYDTKLTEIVKISNDGGKNPRGSYKNADTGWNIVSSSVGYDETISHSGRDKMSVRALENIDKIIEKSVLLDTEVSEYGRGKKSSGTAFIHKFYALINVDGTPYIAKMAVDESYQSKQDTYKKFYHVRAIKMTPAFSVGTGFNQIAHLLNTGVNISISDLHNFVKQYDKDFQPKSVNVDLLSGDGTPKVLYHGTNADFTEFDISKNKTITFGNGFYFGENKDAVSQYYAGENGKVMEAYLNMKKPFVIETSQLKDIDAVPAVVGNYFGEVNVTKGNIRDILKSHGYDGIHYKNTKTKGNDVWVAYDSGQIKSATDNIGTFDGKNPDVRYSLSGTTNLDAYWENYDGFDEVRYSLSVDIERELGYFEVSKKLNDYIGVQKNVLPKLEAENYFGEVVNEETGMVIEIGRKGIKETLGSGKRFQTLPRELKELKIATIHNIPDLIRRGKTIDNNVENWHYDSPNYMYLKTETNINGVPYDITIDIRRTSAKNKFWMHNIRIKEKNSELLSSGKNQSVHEIQNFNNKIPSKKTNVKNELKYSLSGTTNLDAYWENYDGFDEVFGSSASILEEGALAMQGKEVDRDTVKKLARKMKQEYRSNIDLDTFTDNLVKVFSYMQTQKKANYEDMLRVMNEIAMPVIEESMGYDATEVQQYKEMKQKLRGYKLKLTEEQKQEVGYYYGNYEVFRRSCFGTLNFTDNGTYLDSVWSELVELTGGFLEYGINDKDQAIMLKYAVDAMKPQLRNNFGADNHGVAMDLSLRIYEEYFKAQEGAKAEKLRKAMVHERVEFHDKLRKQYYEKLAAERKRMKEKTGTIAQRVAEVKAANTQSQLEKVNRQRAAQYRNEIKRTGGELIRWIETPTDKKHVPEALKKTTLEFLSAIDFISHRALDDSDSTRRWQEKMGAVARQLQMAEQSELSDEYGNFIIDLDPDFVPMLETFLRKNDGVEKISQMEYDQLENLNTLMTTLKRTIAKANELHRNDRYKYVAEVANGTIVELQKKKNRKSHAKAVDMASNLLNFDMLDSFTYFETLGGAATSIHKEIREGFNTRTWHLKEAQEYMQELLKGKKIKDWTGDKAQVHEFNTRDGKLKLSTGQIMSLYLLGKRSQGMQHILSGGIRAAQTGRGKKQIWQVKPQHVTKGLYQEMIGVLTEEQMDVADKMQKFLAKNCAEWGNHTSMTLYNYKKFMDERYFPIKTYDNSRMTNDKNTSDTASLYAIKNQGMTKNLVPEARNALVVEDIMDVFTNHVTAMANYDAFAVPLSDAMKWFNYKNEGMVGEQLESDSVKEELERVYGRKAKDYFIQFMKDINGEAGNGSSEKISEAFISRYKAAAVGANVRVAIQQPTAYMRAALLLNPIDMMRGMAGMPNVKRAKEYSAIALWKSWGYYETSIGQSMKQVITGQSTLSDNIRDKASILAALGDEVTWGYLWNACENEIRRTRKDIKPDTEEFYRKVAERFDDVIDQTQVVDTVLHRSQFMKDKDNLRKLEAAFMSEPTKSYNMLYRGIKKGKKELAKAVLVYGMTGVLTSLAAAVMDAVRDDDREKTFREKYLESVKGNLLDNVNILGTIPYIKDVFSFVNGYEAERMDMAGIANLISSMQMIYKYVFDDSKKTTYGVVKSAARAVSQVSGIPFYNLLREVESLAENITGENWLTNKESNTELYRKLIQYGEEGNEEKYQKTMDKLLENGIEQEEINKKVISEAKKQFKEGELSRAETEDILKEYGMEADDIYWALNKAEEGDDYNKYNELYEAVESGKGLKSAIRELTGHGVKEKTIGSRITAQYKEQYVKLYRTNKTKAAALKARLLNAYVQLGFDREKRSKAIDNWIE